MKVATGKIAANPTHRGTQGVIAASDVAQLEQLDGGRSAALGVAVASAVGSGTGPAAATAATPASERPRAIPAAKSTRVIFMSLNIGLSNPKRQRHGARPFLRR
jgi:hypothetical protein